MKLLPSSHSPTPAARVPWQPWSIGLLLAVGSYCLLHHLADEGGGPPMALGQYLLPLVFVVATATMALRPGRGGGRQSLERMSIDAIQALLRETFQAQGYQLVDSAAGAPDRHADVVLRRDRETYLVWAKPWREKRVDVEPVEQLCRAMGARGARGGFLVTTGRFSRDANAHAAAHNVRLIDGAALRGLIAAPRRGRPSQH